MVERQDNKSFLDFDSVLSVSHQLLKDREEKRLLFERFDGDQDGKITEEEFD